MLQFITNTEASATPAEQIRGFISGGGRWVQIRMKEASDEEIEKVVADVKPLCLETETFLLLDDRVELAKKLDVGGVHLGREDMLPSRARMLLGPAAVIGVTANTLDDIKAVRSLDIDYIGMGPYADTKTKKNLAPILGLEGIRDLCTGMERLEINIGHVAVGGIRPVDVVPLMEAGVNGVAVSGAIACARDIAAKTAEFLDILRPFKRN